MRRIRFLLIPLIAFILVVGLDTGVSQASLIMVPRDYPDIYTAVDRAPIGSTILVVGNQSIKDPVFITKPLTIRGGLYLPYSPDNPPSTYFLIASDKVRLFNMVIDGGGSNEKGKSIGVWVYDGRDVVISGLEIILPVTGVMNVGFRNVIPSNIGIMVSRGNVSIYDTFIISEMGVVISESLEFVSAIELSPKPITELPRTEFPRKAGVNNPKKVIESGSQSKSIYVKLMSNEISADVGIYVASYMYSPVVKSVINSFLTETTMNLVMNPYFPYDVILNSIKFYSYGDKASYWEGGEGITFKYPAFLRILAGANTFVSVEDASFNGYVRGVDALVGGRFGRAIYGGNIKISLDGVTGYTENTDFFINIQHMEGDSSFTVNDVDAYGDGGEAFLYVQALRNVNSFRASINDTLDSGYRDGVVILGGGGKFNNIWIRGYRYIHDYRDGYGLMIRGIIGSPVNPLGPTTKEFSKTLALAKDDLKSLLNKEDILFMYSVLWKLYINPLEVRDPKNFIGVTLYETVYDQSMNSILIRSWINSIWTLRTVVLSSLTETPLQGVSIDYLYGSLLRASGATDMNGVFEYQVIHRIDGSIYDPLDVYTLSGSYISRLSVEASLGGVFAREFYIPYVGDTITLPSWYGEIVIWLRALAFRIVGFSHDMGTTSLWISGMYGGYGGFYSEKPTSIEDGAPVINQDRGSHGGEGDEMGYRFYSIRIKKIIEAGSLIILKGVVHYEGYWHPTEIYINKLSGLVWSPGPVDFRGWLVRG